MPVRASLPCNAPDWAAKDVRRGRKLPAPTSLPQRGRKTLAGKADGVHHAPGHVNVRAFAGDAVILAEDPDLAGAVVELIDACAKRAVGLSHRPGKRYFLVIKAAGVLLDLV